MHPTRQQAIQSIANSVSLYDEGQDQSKMSEVFGTQTFNRKAMQKHLSKETFDALQKVIRGENKFEHKLAEAVAEGVKSWALSNGVTHYTHWFQPMTGLTAEKHDSLLSFDTEEGSVLEKFSAAQLIQSEPDASSFPSGGMRSTFEARGYTAWDPSSPLFFMEAGGSKTLCIPSVFVSYTGHSLDTKTGLLKSIEVLNTSAVELLHEMGETKVTQVTATLGCEQEYFLIDNQFVNLRPDLLLTGRTLLSSDMPKGQQLEDHYFGSIPARVQAYMKDVEWELYRLGVPVKTRHNEVAPSQFETAPIFEEANLAADHNMLTMEVLKRVATQHGLVCLLHEKPFAGINGSGKHNNWSMGTDTGLNLLEPGKTPHSNVRFIAILSCVLDAVNKQAIALRAAIASHGNDHRLGANEAPPAIISAFLGSTLTEIVEHLESGKDLSKRSAEQSVIELGLNRLPSLPKDNTDRNRTSPFAFTGNKFEFRAVGSSHSIAFAITILNTAVSQSLDEFAKTLKTKKAGATSLDAAILEVAKEFFSRSRNVRFEGNGYSQEWRDEATKRNLPQLMNTPQSLAAFAKESSYAFLVEKGIYAKDEIEARIAIRREQYIKHLDIEGQTFGTMVKQYVLPAAYLYQNQLAEAFNKLTTAGIEAVILKGQKEYLREFCELVDQTHTRLNQLKTALNDAHHAGNEEKTAMMMAEKVVPAMASLRETVDRIEASVPDELWSLPKYREMLFIR